MLRQLEISEKDVNKALMEILYSCREPYINIESSKYHHNTTYEKVPVLIENGILSFKLLKELNKEEITEREMYLRSDPCYVNGIDHISVSKSLFLYGDDYKNDELYDHTLPGRIDIVLSDKIPAYGIGINYANEFLVKDKIDIDMFNSIDIRLLSYLLISDDSNDLISKYNNLRNLAILLKKKNIDIPIREMSDDLFSINKEKLSSAPILVLKK